jgi:transcriptional regulator with XRE-family HTH domain
VTTIGEKGMTPTSETSILSNRPTTTERLRKSFKDREYADAYARSALNAYIATQIKVIREQRGWTQGKLADEAEMKQPRIAVMEDVDYSSWSISTLWRLAQAFHLRLKVSFEEFGSLPQEIGDFDRQSLERLPLEEDPFIVGNIQTQVTGSSNSFVNVVDASVGGSITDNIGLCSRTYSYIRTAGTVSESLGSTTVQQVKFVWVGSTGIQQDHLPPLGQASVVPTSGELSVDAVI